MSEQLNQFNRLQAIGPVTAETLVDAGYSLRADGRLDQAIACWRLARRLFPLLSRRNPRLHTNFHLDSNIHHCAEEIRAVKRWLRPVPSGAPPAYQVAVVAACEGNFAQAEEEFHACVTANILTDSSWYCIAVLRLHRNDSVGAFQAIAAAFDAGYRYYRLAHFLGRLHFQQLDAGNDCIVDARTFYQSAVDAMPDDEYLLIEFGSFLRERCGDYEAAKPLLAHAAELRDARIARHPLGRHGIVSIGHYAYAIGSMAHDFEYLAKLMELGWIKDLKPQIAVPPGRMANVDLVRYFKKYFTVVEDEELCQALDDTYSEIDLDPSVLHVPGRSFRWSHDLHTPIERAWQQERRPPLLAIEPEDRARGKAILRDHFGMPQDAWYVSFYIRNIGYKSDSVVDRYRHSNLEDYLPAMRRVVEHGGWAIWFGDAWHGMKLPELGERVISYANSPIKGDFMDLFLWATSRFYVGSHGGASFPPRLFGVPVLFSNHSPLSVPSWKPEDRMLPKGVWSNREERLLTLSDTRHTPFFYLGDGRRIASLGLEMRDAEPEAIVEAIDEMLDPDARNAALDAMREEYQTLETNLGDVHSPPLTYSYLRRHGSDYIR